MRLRLLYIEDRSDTAMESILGQFQRLLIIGNGSFEQLFLSVETARLEVIQRQICVHTQANRRQVRSARLGLFASGFDDTPHPAPGVNLVRKIKGQDEITGGDAIKD